MKKWIWLAVVASIIAVVVVSRIASVDEIERESRAYESAVSKFMASRDHSAPTATPFPIVVTRLSDGSFAFTRGVTRGTPRPIRRSTPTPDPGAVCDEDFVGQDTRVEDAIVRVYEINYATIEESASPEEFASKRPDAIREVAQVWRDTAANARGVPSRLLGGIAEIWERSATIPIDDVAAHADSLRSITDVYLDLVSEFEKCESTKSFVTDLRQEAEGLRQLADELN